MAIQIPLLRVKGIIEALLLYVSDDLTAHIAADLEEESYLYRLLEGNNSDGYDFYEQAKEIFLRTDEYSNKLTVKLMYPKDMSSFPYIWVREPAKTKGQVNGIGKLSGQIFVNEDTTFSDEYYDGKTGMYEAVVMSESLMESIMISEVIHSLLISAYETFNSMYNLFEFEMKELIFNNDQTSPFMLINRGITLTIDFNSQIPSLDQKELINKLKFVGIPIEE